MDELGLAVRNRYLIINRVQGEHSSLLSLAEGYGLKLAGWLPEDNLVAEHDLKGIPVFQLPGESQILRNFYTILNEDVVPF